MDDHAHTLTVSGIKRWSLGKRLEEQWLTPSR